MRRSGNACPGGRGSWPLTSRRVVHRARARPSAVRVLECRVLDGLARLSQSALTQVLACPVCDAEPGAVTARLPLDSNSDSVRLGFHSVEDEISLRKCDECTLMYLDPRPSAATLTEYYSTICPKNEAITLPWDRDTRPLYARRARARWRALARLVRAHQPDVKTVIDIGALDGASLVPFLGTGTRAIAVEPGGSSRASASPHIEFVDDIHSPELDGARADAVISTQTFEHLLEPREVASAAARLLSPTGILVIEVPYDLLSVPGLAEGGGTPVGLHPEHLNIYSHNSLAALAASAGLGVITIEAGVQIHKYGGLLPSLTLIASPSPRSRKPSPADAVEADRQTIRRLQRRMKWTGRLAGRGRW